MPQGLAYGAFVVSPMCRQLAHWYIECAGTFAILSVEVIPCEAVRRANRHSRLVLKMKNVDYATIKLTDAEWEQLGVAITTNEWVNQQEVNDIVIIKRLAIYRRAIQAGMYTDAN